MERIYSEIERIPVPLVTRVPANRGKQERKKNEDHIDRKKEKKADPLPENDTPVINQTENEVDSDADGKGLRVDIQV